MERCKKIARGAAAGLLSAAVLMSSMLTTSFGQMRASAAEVRNPQATLTVDLDPAVNTGDIVHGAAGFLYGVSSEDVPTTNTIVPLKSKILVTKGALGTEHPYGDALDVAKTFLESGGEQVQMYNSNYYGVFGVTATIEQYCDDLKNYICPAVVAWKEAWKEEHGTPEAPKDNIGARIDIDEAIVYIPINEGTPAGGDFQKAWKSYYDAIKSVDENASLAGPNSGTYNSEFTWGQDMRSYTQFCADNNCMPDVITWHELDTWKLEGMSSHVADFRNLWESTDWSKYNEANGTEGIPEIPQICFNEYAEMDYCGVPGRLVNWIARIEDEKATGCLPFWHQANNLNDLASGANEGNGAWWLYKWYGDMSGTTQPVSTSTNYDGLYGVSTMDEAKKLSTTLLGGFTGDITVQLNNVTATSTFADAEVVHVSVQETMFTGFHGTAYETPTILEGAYPVNDDGSVTVKIPDTLFENAYNVTVTQASGDEIVGLALRSSSGDVYEAEDAGLSGGAFASSAGTNPSYYMSNNGSGDRAVGMPSGSSMIYTINVPADGKYKLDFNYGNGQGTERNDMNTHNPVNVKQTFALDGGEAETVTMESTLFQTMDGTKTLYYDLTAGEHQITVTTADSGVDGNLFFHDFVRVSYAGVYGQELPAFNKVYEAELADVNRLLGNTDSTVSTETSLEGYSGGGYVMGLSDRAVTEGGGIRNTVVVEESGLYNITLRYQSSQAGEASIYVGNTAVTLDRVNKTVSLQAGDGWQEVTASVYLQKGINVVDLDTTVPAALDYMRVRALPAQDSSTTIEAEDAIPEELEGSIQVAESDGASGGKYVVGMKGAYQDADYLEFTYNAPEAGKYQMQAFHSNEDLAGSHWYNIKAIDKYAVVDVNGTSQYPRFEGIVPVKPEGLTTYYFVDCGDHGVSTVTKGDEFGENNSVTDQIYGEDAETGYSWGVVDPKGDYDTEGPGLEQDTGVYTEYTWASEYDQVNNVAQDDLDKETTFRYARGQDTAGITPREVTYKFELDPGKYDVEVGMSNTWGNAGSPIVTLSAGEVEDVVSEPYSSGSKTLTIDLTDATPEDNGRVVLTVKGTTAGDTLQMTYITITDSADDGKEYFILPPGEEKIPVENIKDAEGVYTGELADGVDWFIDYRNMKNDTDRYFFINTFSDDTFREKTITLDLQKGENTIRIYNDNSWNVTYGGSTSQPGLNYLANYTPNFDKFVITPMALNSAVELEEEYTIDVASTEYGIASANQNTVGENGEYTVSMIPAEGKEIVNVLVNGADRTDDIVFDEASGAYQLKISGVSEDQKVQVYFSKPNTSKDSLKNLYNEYKDLEKGTYSTATWEQFDRARTEAQQVLKDDDAPQWKINNAYDKLLAGVNGLKDIGNLVFFVDCGDHGVSTVTKGDDFGRNNSVTDQIYGKDAETGYSWGVVDPKGDYDTEGPGLEQDTGVYTEYTWASEYDQVNNVAQDDLDKETTFRYARGQDTAGITPREVTYKFELDPGKYDVEVGMSNTWGNAGSPIVTLSAGEVEDVVSEPYSSGSKTLTIDLTDATPEDNGRVVLTVKGTTAGDTLQMTYITINKSVEAPVLDRLEVAAPTIVEYELGEELNTDGMVVKAVYSDGSSKVLTAEQYTLSGFSSDKAGTKTVTVSYTENEITKTASFDVTVKEAPVVIPVDKTGLKEKLDEAKAIGPDGVTEGSYEKLQNAIQEAEGVYNDPNASQDAVNQQIQKLIGAISGLKPVLSGLEVSDPVKTEYAVGERLDTTGMTVTAQYSDGTTVTLASGQYTVSGFDSATAGEKQVTVSYTEDGVTKTAAFTVTVKESSGSSEDPGSSEGPGTGSSGSESGGTESGTGSGTENNNNAQTGDGMTVPIILLSLLVAASAGIAVVLGKKRRLG
ncbi:MAG: bacterial Ig-like domain-containing protein [[Clostridium] leptum]